MEGEFAEMMSGAAGEGEGERSQSCRHFGGGGGAAWAAQRFSCDRAAYMVWH